MTASVRIPGSLQGSLAYRDRADLLETIRLESGRLERLVANLLDLSRLEAGAAQARPELWRRVVPVSLLATVGVILTVVLIAALARFGLGLDWPSGFLLGSIVAAPTRSPW